MSKISRSKSGEEGGFTVTIPADVRFTIQSIRETTGKQHSDEEIYSVLQDCSMDPNETAQKLLYLDTFHEVKKKRDRKNEGQGARGGRGNYYSNAVSAVAGSGRNATPRRENGINHLTERGPVLWKTKNNAIPHGTKSPSIVPNGTSILSNGGFSDGRDTELSAIDVIPQPEDSTAVDAKKLVTAPLLPTPTFASMIKAEKDKSTSSSNHLPTSASPASVSGVYSLDSDPVLSSPVSQNSGVVGTIIREVGSQRKVAEPNNIQVNKNVSSNVDIESSKREKEVYNTLNSVHKKKAESKLKEVEKNQLSEPLRASSLANYESSLATYSSDNDSQAPQESIAPPNVVTAGGATIPVKANSQLLPESTVTDSQHVSFPSHFKVSEAAKNGLTFGSIDPCFGFATKDSNGTTDELNSVCTTLSSCGGDVTAGEPSPSGQNISSTTQGEAADHLQSPSTVDKVPLTVGNISTSTELKYDELKQETLLPPEGQPKPSVQSVPNYGFGFMLPAAENQLVQMEGPETQNGNSLTPSSSPTPSVQSSGAAPPQPVHLFRQPYPSFLSYGHYLSPYFLPQIHQFLSHNGLPQQPSNGNIYLSSAAASGVKFPVSQFKPGTTAGNPTHIGVASGYGSYGSSFVGFNPITDGTSGKATSNEDLAASQLKDNHIYTTRPLSEGSGVWIPAPGHDLSNMQINPLYNLTLQGQHIAFAPAQTGHSAFTGICQPAQTLAAPSNVNPLLQQSQAMAAAVETMGPPSGTYQQPQLAQVNWNPSY